MHAGWLLSFVVTSLDRDSSVDEVVLASRGE